MKTIQVKCSRAINAFICMLVCWLVPSSIRASVEVDGIYYDLNTSAKTAAVTTNPNYYSGAINIPTSIDYNGSTYNVKSIGSRAFLNCSELISITFPNSVTTIGSSAFERCTGLTDVVIGDGVTFIDYEAFKNCSSLSSLTLPSSLKTIENETFSGCTSLVEIIAKRTTPPTIVNTTFDGVDKTACIVYVPDGCQSTYAKAANWKVFSNILECTVVASGSCGDNVTYTIYTDMTMVISGTGEMWDYYEDNHIDNDYYHLIEKIIIEDGVSTIGAYAFKDCAELKSISISNSVSSIGYSIFWNCTSLTSVVIPSEVKSIDDGVFSCCPGLTSIQVSTSNTSYDSRENCNAIIETATNRLVAGCQNTNIPNSVTSIGQSSFDGCTGLTSISIPNSVTSIGWCSFYGCTGLTSLIIPNNVTNIEGRAFSGCSGLTSLTISNSLTIIEEETFSGCSGLTSLTIPNSVTRIDEAAFEGCSGFTSLVIPSSVTSIGGSAFLGCTGLISVTIPSNLNQFGLMAFGACPNISKIYLKNDNPPVCNGITFDEEVRNSSILYVPSGSKTAYKRAYIWSGFDHIVEARDLEILANGFCGENVVYTIYSDMTMVISGTGMLVGDVVDLYWNDVEKVVIEEGITSIGNLCFYNCTKLKSFYIEDSDNELLFSGFRNGTFANESSLEYVYLGRNIRTENLSESSFQSPPLASHENLQTLEIGDKVTCLEDHCFGGDPIKSLTIGRHVQSIGIGALDAANKGQTLVIPSNVKRMGDYCLSSEISTLVLEKGDDDIELFGGSYSLELSFCINSASIDSIYVGRNLTGNSGFGIGVKCRSALIDVSLNRQMSENEDDDINLPYPCPPICSTNLYFGSDASLGQYYFWNSPVEHIYNLNPTHVGRYAFSNCNNLKTIDFNVDEVTSIGEGVFYGCNGLTTLSIPDGITSIDTYAFGDCKNLTSVKLANSVSYIGDGAFLGCRIDNLYVGPDPAEICGSSFDYIYYIEDEYNEDVSYGPFSTSLYVPVGCKSVYKQSEYWSKFVNIVEYGDEDDTDISILDNAIYVEQVEGRVGGTMDIPVKLKNNYPVRGFVFTLELPEGATINSWKLSTNRLPSGATLSDKFSTQKIEGNKINVACSLNYGDATFTGNDGEIATVNVTFANDMEVGEYPIYLTACDISDAGGTDNKLSDIKATLVLEDYVEGDANGDGVVLIGDVIAILNYIVGVTSNNFNEKAADVNGDGEILIGDVIAVLNIIVSQ